jgi:hypothetical protein
MDARKRAYGVQFRPAHSTLLPHNFHALVETGGQNMRRGE